MDEREFSPDLFENSPVASPKSTSSQSTNETIGSQNLNPQWRGSSMEEIYHRKGIWDWDPPPLKCSNNHVILFHLPIRNEVPVPYKFSGQTCWDQDHVRMPFAPQNLYPVEEGSNTVLKQRWELICEALAKPIKNCDDLKNCILFYNSKYSERWRFRALYHFFENVIKRAYKFLAEEESEYFFETIMPKIVELALRLPELLPSSVPLLKKNKNKAISLSQLQIASLLANAFLCTFPRRNTTRSQAEYAFYPDINFNKLFQSYDRSDCVSEKLKCICNYFRRVCTKTPDGVVTFERRVIQRCDLPQWDKSDKKLGTIKLHVTSTGTIDDDGLGLLQVDFANKYIGGGVLGFGCVQEEIRFVLCPELIVSCLFTEELGPTEALNITGVEQYNKSEGYADSFRWTEDYIDPTPRDTFNRKKCYLVAIDALHFGRPSEQFKSPNMLRELNKAYVGYFNPTINQTVPAVATGNWGCGAFRGDPYLKSLLQLMVCHVVGRDLVYYTFQNERLRDRIYTIFCYLCEHNVTVGQLWNYLIRFDESRTQQELYSFIRRVHENNDLSIAKSSFFTPKSAKVARIETSNSLSNNEIESMLNEDIDEFSSIDFQQTSESKKNTSRPSGSVLLDKIEKIERSQKNITFESNGACIINMESVEETKCTKVNGNDIEKNSNVKRLKITDYFK